MLFVQLLLVWVVFSSTLTLRLFLRLSYWAVGLLSAVEYATRKLNGSKSGLVANYRPSRFLRIEDKNIDAFAQHVASGIRRAYGGIEHVVDARNPTKGFGIAAAFWLTYKLLGAFSLKSLFLIAIIGAFAVPRLYLEFQQPIDNALGQGCHHVHQQLAKGKKLAYEKAGPQIEMVQKLIGTHRDRGGFPSHNGKGVAPLKEVPGSAADTSATSSSVAPESVPTFLGNVSLDSEEGKKFAAAAAGEHPPQ